MFLLPENVLRALGEYLGKQPYIEVVGLMNALQILEKAKDENKDKKVQSVPKKVHSKK